MWVNEIWCKLQVLDVGHNQLMNVSVTNLMASQISLLDMSLNTQLKVDPREYKAVKYVSPGLQTSLVDNDTVAVLLQIF